jgi:hypothetical protein
VSIKIIYIAGPFSAPTAWGIEQNVRRAESIAAEVVKLGAMPLCPHANTRFFHGFASDEFFIEGTMELLRRCDAVALTPDWRCSQGARGEEIEARRLGLPVFDWSTGAGGSWDLRAWLLECKAAAGGAH